MSTVISSPIGQLVVVQSSGASSVITRNNTPQLVVSSLVTAPIFRTIEIKLISDATFLTTGDLVIWCVPEDFNGLNLIDMDAFVTTASTSGKPTVTLRNITQANSYFLTTAVTIDINETSSYTASVIPVIDTANDDVATGDLIAVEVTAIGTGTKGMGVIMRFA